MYHTLKIFAATCALFACSVVANAQGVTGLTTADIDPSTGIITVTCETDLDANAQEYYGSQVVCLLKDGSGNLVDSGQYDDNNGTQGYAQVVLTYQGVPGNIYFATGEHVAFTIFTDEDLGGYDSYNDDYYNLGAVTESYEEGYDYYPQTFMFFAPGPETPTRKDTIKIANTVDSVADPLSALSLTTKFIGAVDSDDGMKSTFDAYFGGTNDPLGPFVGNVATGQNVCQIGNESIGTVTSGSAVGPFTVKRTLTTIACYSGSTGTSLTGCPGASPGIDDTGTWIDTRK